MNGAHETYTPHIDKNGRLVRSKKVHWAQGDLFAGFMDEEQMAMHKERERPTRAHWEDITVRVISGGTFPSMEITVKDSFNRIRTRTLQCHYRRLSAVLLEAMTEIEDMYAGDRLGGL